MGLILSTEAAAGTPHDLDPGEFDLYANVERRAMRSTRTVFFLNLFVKGSRTIMRLGRSPCRVLPAMTQTNGRWMTEW